MTEHLNGYPYSQDVITRLHERAESYRQSGPSAEHTAALLDEAAGCIAALLGDLHPQIGSTPDDGALAPHAAGSLGQQTPSPGWREAAARIIAPVAAEMHDQITGSAAVNEANRAAWAHALAKADQIASLPAPGGWREIETDWFAFLTRKYVQRSDERQAAMGLQYTEAETHDLARECARFAALQGPAPVDVRLAGEVRRVNEPQPPPNTGREPR